MRGSARSSFQHDLVEVAILDDATREGETDDPPEGSTPGPRRPRVTRPAVAVVVALALVTIGANVAEAQKERARRDAVASLPWTLEPLTDPMTVAWRIDGFRVSAGDDVLLFRHGDSLTAVDPATGGTRWSLDLPGHEVAQCEPVGAAAAEASNPFARRSTATLPRRNLLGCPARAEFSPVTGADFTQDLTVIDASTGVITSTLGMPDALASAAWPLEQDVLVVGVTPDGRATVTRYDPTDGREVWRSTSEVPLVTPGSVGLPRVHGTEGVLVLGFEPVVGFSLDDGRTVDLDTLPYEEPYLASALPGGGEVRLYHERTSEGRNQVVEADGTIRFTLEEDPLLTLLSDGSVPGVLVVGDGRRKAVHGVDVRTGERLWSAETTDWEGPLLRIDGVLLLVDGTDAVALDVQDGTSLWTVPVRSRMVVRDYFAIGLTDGDTVLLPELADDEGERRTDLVARSIADGVEGWRTPMPSEVRYLEAGPEGTLLGRTDDGYVGFGRVP